MPSRKSDYPAFATFSAQVSKVQRQLSEARSEVENLGMELRSNVLRLETGQRLSNAVINLWNKMHDNSEVSCLMGL